MLSASASRYLAELGRDVLDDRIVDAESQHRDPPTLQQAQLGLQSAHHRTAGGPAEGRREQQVQPGLVEGHARLRLLHPGAVHVDASDLVARPGEAGGRHGPDVAGADHSDAPYTASPGVPRTAGEPL